MWLEKSNDNLCPLMGHAGRLQHMDMHQSGIITTSQGGREGGQSHCTCPTTSIPQKVSPLSQQTKLPHQGMWNRIFLTPLDPGEVSPIISCKPAQLDNAACLSCNWPCTRNSLEENWRDVTPWRVPLKSISIFPALKSHTKETGE